VKIGRVVRRDIFGPETRIVIVDVEKHELIDVQYAELIRLQEEGSSDRSAKCFANARFPTSLSLALESADFVDALRTVEQAKNACARATFAWDDCQWIAPVDPPRYRDFMSFEQHHLTSAILMGAAKPPDVVYKLPTYYKGNHLTMIGTDAEVPWPGYSDFMDFELELGFVIGSPGQDLTPEEAERCIFGVTILNDFSARDRQVRESSSGLGPAKGKDFATAIGPWITTVDDLDLSNLTMEAFVNGESWARGSSGSAMWSPAEIVAYASTAEHLVSGELLGSGTLGGGCGVEAGRRLIPGDLLELEVSGIGTLRNRMGEPNVLRWEPTPRVPGVTINGGAVEGPTRPMSPRSDALPPPVVLDEGGKYRIETVPGWSGS
jgi:2-keto-4-pentenoate hydratase/2-oxohepta-3-ene-1,7-dioic acid hydratase in catechol pathway